jgi:hypothetical protein
MTAHPAAYAGDPRTRAVVIRLRDGRTRPLRHYVCHSPTGFNWGYGGSGPADLALSILCHALGVPAHTSPRIFTNGRPLSRRLQQAWVLHQHFKETVIANLPMDQPWELPVAQVRTWIALHVLGAPDALIARRQNGQHTEHSEGGGPDGAGDAVPL